MGDKLYFTANDGVHGWELWQHDGSSASLVANITPSWGSTTIGEIAQLGSLLVVSADDGTNGAEPWVLNGTVATMLGDIYEGPAGSSPTNFVVAGDFVYFVAIRWNMGQGSN